MRERWKFLQIEGGEFWVSSFGRVRYRSGKITYGTTATRTHGAGGYKQVYLSNNGRPKFFRVNRLVAMAFIPNPLNLPQTNHLNCLTSDNRVSNLEWCTAKQNRAHALANGLISTIGDNHWTRKYPERLKRGSASHLFKHPYFGAKHSMAKLTDAQVYEIRKAREAGEKLKPLAMRYGVSTRTIGLIHNRQRWAHLP